MDLKKFSELNRERCESGEGFNHPIAGWTYSDWMTAFVGEVGEAANIIKKLNRIRDDIPGNKPHETRNYLEAALSEELADAFTYLDLMAQSAGIDLSDAVVTKFNAMSRRIDYPVII